MAGRDLEWERARAVRTWPHATAPLSRPQWDLVCDLGWQVILEQILFILGFASGYLFLGYPADR